MSRARLWSAIDLKIRRKMARTSTASNPTTAIPSRICRTSTGGSMDQSSASETQNAIPNQATASANPSPQTYPKMRSRKDRSIARIAGAS